MNLLVILTRRDFGKFSGTRGYAFGPCDERLGIEGPLHIIAILATRAAILRFVGSGRVEPVYTVHTRFKIEPSTIDARKYEHRLGLVIR